MQIIENDKVKEKLYVKKTESGLTIMVMPKKGISKKYVIIGTNYGSIDNKFIVPGEDIETEVPDGIAHFLEHKMFEQENGENSLDTLTALGANANAYTTNDHTAYLFETTDNFDEALDELLDYVQHPYFTDENVEKEKGIIGQEIMMYDDYPEFKVYLNALKNMYKENPINIDITGTKESISKIDKEVLYKCYNTFYHPSNMAIMICGDFDVNEIISKVEEKLVKRDSQTDIKRIYPEEPESILSLYKEENMEVSIPIFIIAIKDKVEMNQEKVRKHIAIEIILNILMGKSSKLYNEMYNQNLVKAELDSSYEFGNNYAHVVIQGQSNNPEKILSLLKEELNNLKANGIPKEEFERTRKGLYASYVKEYNNIAQLSNMFLSDCFKGICCKKIILKYSERDGYKWYFFQVLG